eukprot:gene5533-138_t
MPGTIGDARCAACQAQGDADSGNPSETQGRPRLGKQTFATCHSSALRDCRRALRLIPPWRDGTEPFDFPESEDDAPEDWQMECIINQCRVQDVSTDCKNEKLLRKSEHAGFNGLYQVKWLGHTRPTWEPVLHIRPPSVWAKWVHAMKGNTLDKGFLRMWSKPKPNSKLSVQWLSGTLLVEDELVQSAWVDGNYHALISPQGLDPEVPPGSDDGGAASDDGADHPAGYIQQRTVCGLPARNVKTFPPAAAELSCAACVDFIGADPGLSTPSPLDRSTAKEGKAGKRPRAASMESLFGEEGTALPDAPFDNNSAASSLFGSQSGSGDGSTSDSDSDSDSSSSSSGTADSDAEGETECHACQGTKSEENDLICDKCDKPYHLHCVGLNSVPDGEWLCLQCSGKRRSTLQCCACLGNSSAGLPCVRCDECNKPFHAKCVELTSDAPDDWVCSNCKADKRAARSKKRGKQGKSSNRGKGGPKRRRAPSPARSVDSGWGTSVECNACRGSKEEDDDILCDRCNRSYHLRCVRESSVPVGRWVCPRCTGLAGALIHCAACLGTNSNDNDLLCDDCDRPFHLACLGLEEPPKEEKWSCPRCAGAGELNIHCCKCHQGDENDDDILCDGCDRPFHLACMALDSVPEGDWLCPDCPQNKPAPAVKKPASKGHGKGRGFQRRLRPPPEQDVDGDKRLLALRGKQRQELVRLKQQQAQMGEDVPAEQKFNNLLSQVKLVLGASSDGNESDADSDAGAGGRRHRSGRAEEGLVWGKKAQGPLTLASALDADYLEGLLRPYQVEGVNWMLERTFRCFYNLPPHVPPFRTANLLPAWDLWSFPDYRPDNRGANSILADEMGLGKTFQSIALLASMKHLGGQPGPHLVVVPLSVMSNWEKEFAQWCPSLPTFVFRAHLMRAATRCPKKDSRDMARQLVEQRQYEVCITTYEMVVNHRSTFAQVGWRYLIVDEAHRIKNDECKLANALRTFRTMHRLLLTGTPLQNNLRELWSLLNFLTPDVFDDGDTFGSWFDVASGGAEHRGILNDMHRLLSPFMLRRMKVDVTPDIPPKKEIYVGCGMSDIQRKWYKDVLIKEVRSIDGTGKPGKQTLSNIVMHLRKAANHPYLFDGAEDGPPYVNDHKLVDASGKLKMLDKLLAKLHGEGHRVLIFSQFSRMLDILEDHMDYRQYDFCRLDGQVSAEERADQMEIFNAPGSTKFVFLLTTRAGGVGLNLQTADTVVLFDSDWNPQMDIQAQDRAHRIGQTKPVTVFRLVSNRTLEEKIYQRSMKKLFLDAVVVQQGMWRGRSGVQRQGKAEPSSGEILSMVRWGAEEMFKGEADDEVTDEQIDAILQRGADKQREMEEEVKKSEQLTLENFQQDIRYVRCTVPLFPAPASAPAGMPSIPALRREEDMWKFDGIEFRKDPTHTIYLEGIDQTVHPNMVRDTFTEFGRVEEVAISVNRDIAVVRFKYLESAATAKREFSGRLGCVDEIRVRFGKPGQVNLNLPGTQYADAPVHDENYKIAPRQRGAKDRGLAQAHENVAGMVDVCRECKEIVGYCKSGCPLALQPQPPQQNDTDSELFSPEKAASQAMSSVLEITHDE